MPYVGDPTIQRSPFGQALRDARRDRGISQAALAEMLGLGNSTIAHWEANGRLPASERTIRQLEQILDIDLSPHLDETDEAHDQPAHPLAIVAPQALEAEHHVCETCEALDRCSDDVHRHALPAWCEFVTRRDIQIARASGQLERLKSRYPEGAYVR